MTRYLPLAAIVAVALIGLTIGAVGFAPTGSQHHQPRTALVVRPACHAGTTRDGAGNCVGPDRCPASTEQNAAGQCMPLPAPVDVISQLHQQPVLKHHATDPGVNPSSCPVGSQPVDGGCAPAGSPENP